MSIGNRITELRKQNNISQGQLAQALNVTRQAVSKWENDQAVPDALKMIHLADLLDTDIEYLSTGRRNFARRPPVVITETKIVEKIVEKPVVQEKLIEKYIEVPVVEIVEKPVTKPVYRTKYVRNPLEMLMIGGISFIVGLLIGILI